MLRTIRRMFLFNAALIIVNILCFSDGFLAFSVSDNRTIIKALSITLIVMDVISFFVVNYWEIMQYFKTKENSKKKKTYEPKDYVHALEKYHNSNPQVMSRITQAVEQLKSFEEKEEAFKIVMQRNNKNLRSLTEELNSAKRVLCDNARKFLNELTVLKASERKRKANPAVINYLDEILQDSGEILLKLDEFLEAVSRMNDKELSDYLTLEETTKFLKQESY